MEVWIIVNTTEMPASVSWLDRLRTLPQYLLPQHLLTAWMHAVTRSGWAPLKNLLINGFIRLYRVDMSIAVQPDYRRYANFNEFFTRELASDARPVSGDPGTMACPVDGFVSQAGLIDGSRIFQAKGHTYSLRDLLADDAGLADLFTRGSFATLYLSPRDYHRIHMPVAGTLKQTIYVPGSLFSVNPVTTRSVPRLFARNERVISILGTEVGCLAMILVGAIFVGSMQTIAEGLITPAGTREIRRWDYADSGNPLSLDKGQEFGRFNMGSTVILLFQKGRIDWLPGLEPGNKISMGQAIARRR